MMRQAGRYQQAYRDLTKRYPTFRQRSETLDLIVEISLQPWRSFRPDGVILFSDILTPLPALGIDFDIEERRGPVIANPLRSAGQLSELHELDLGRLGFVGDALRTLRGEVAPDAAVLGFVGCPWTLATYIVEGGSTRTFTTIKSMCYTAPEVLHALLSHLADGIAQYAIYQADSGADMVMLFDSWSGQLPPKQWEAWSAPFIRRVVQRFKAVHPAVPLGLYINGSAGLLERLPGTGVDVVGLDWSVDMAEARARLGPKVPVQGNVDPAVLFGPEAAIEAAVRDCVAGAGPRGHILNLGHGVLVGTPEQSVGFMFDLSKRLVHA